MQSLFRRPLKTDLYARQCIRCRAIWASSDPIYLHGTNRLCPDCIALLPVIALE